MTYKEIEEQLKTYEGMEKVLKAFSECFTDVDTFAEHLRNGMVSTPHEVDNMMAHATGIYVQFNIIAELADTRFQYVKEQIMIQKKQNIIGEFDSDMLGNCRRIKDIFDAYTKGTEKIISTCQSRLRQFEKEKIIG